MHGIINPPPQKDYRLLPAVVHDDFVGLQVITEILRNGDTQEILIDHSYLAEAFHKRENAGRPSAHIGTWEAVPGTNQAILYGKGKYEQRPDPSDITLVYA
jgi:hypothetical protein